MRLCTLSIILLSLLLSLFSHTRFAQAADDPLLVAPTGPRTPEEERKGFHLPPGFDIELVAAEPMIHKPLNLAFDDRGRLWVTDSIEYPFPAPPDRQGRDSVKILEDTDGDGRADKATVFADGLNIPIGVMPIKDGALVYTIPNIYRMTDTDGDDQADKREVLYGSFGFADTHGMCSSFTWGFDGWLYATHGFANNSTAKGADGSTVKMNSGNTFRLKPDGLGAPSRIEQFTWGQVNPFGLSFDPLGNLYSADCHSRPIYQLLRGAYYPSFGKPHDGLGYGPEMVTHDHGSTGIAGVVYYAADHFPPAYRDTVFIGNPVTNRINHDRIDWHGSTPRGIQQLDFLRSDDPWFRPVNLVLGPDGALYIADFYNKIIGHYEVPLTHPGRDRDRGRIWRIVYRGPDGKGKPLAPRRDWTKASADELKDDLGHPNLAVRMKATNQLAARGHDAGMRELVSAASKPVQRVHALWVLERLGKLEDELLARAAKDAERAVRVHAMRVLSERRELPATLRQLAQFHLNEKDPYVQRAAADALGQHPSPDNVRSLLDLLHATPREDAQLVHVVRMALRNQFRPAETWKTLPTPLSDADARSVADVAVAVPATEAAGFLLRHVHRVPEGPENMRRYLRHIARYGGDEAIAAVVKMAQGNQADDLRHQVELLKAIHQGVQERGGQLPDGITRWAEELAPQLLAAQRSDFIMAGIELVGALRMGTMHDRLRVLAARKEQAEPQRLAACDALVALNAREQVAFLGQLLADAGETPGLRQRTAQVLARINQPEAREALLKGLIAAPAGVQNSIAAELARSPQGAALLLDAVAAGKASPRLLQERPVQLHLAAARVPHLEERLAKLTKGLPPADQRLAELFQRRRAGFVAAKTDPAAGLKVYEKHCASCHPLAGTGAKIGPQLDGIGIRGLDRLLEDMLDPNRNVDQAFRASVLVLNNGQVLTGLVLREEGELVVVADAQGKEIRVPKNTLDQQTVSPLSPMPANLIEQIPEADFYHLLAYLLAQRQPAAGQP